MSLHVIVDGYNLIRQSPSLSRLDARDLQEGREALIHMLTAYRRARGHRVTVVFDGTQAPMFSRRRDRIGGVGVVFSRQGETADAVIARMAEREREKAMVISSDRQVALAASACGSGNISSPAFEERLMMAIAMEAPSGEEDDAPVRQPRQKTRKKGPSRRLPKKIRQQRRRATKL